MLTGANAIAESLIRLGVDHVFGIVGIPVIEVADALIARGIRFISFRNEQAATYAASAYGFVTGKPGVCLVVGGPGLVHALAGMENARSNAFPMLCLAGSAELTQREKGAFQELDQVSAVRSYTKMAAQPVELSQVEPLLERAYRMAGAGRPGCTYIDLPANIIQATLQDEPAQVYPGVIDTFTFTTARCQADPIQIAVACRALKSAKSPLLIIGKGAAYSRAEHHIRDFNSRFKLPFLPTPMGKGVIPDSDSLNVSAARSAALKSADVILLLGARLNWILHYGEPPKFQANVKIIQVDIASEALGDNAGSIHLGLSGDIGLVVDQLANELQAQDPQWSSPPLNQTVISSLQTNTARALKKEQVRSIMTYEPVYKVIRETLSESVGQESSIIYVSEGANTMDISRSAFPLDSPRCRLDAGTNATMGVGLGYAIAAKAARPDSVVVAVEGDSAFGFSAVEVETAVRSRLPMIIYVMNNSGVYHGVDPALYSTSKPLPSIALQLNTKYHDLAESLGARGFLASTLDDVRTATKNAVASNCVCVINVLIDPAKDKKLEFGWMASARRDAKL